MPTEVKLLRSMTAKEIMGVVGKDSAAREAWLKMTENGQQLFHISGDVNSYGSKHTATGETTFLLGIFLARNNLNGKLFKANKVYLPSKGDTENLIAMFKQLRENDPGAIVGFSLAYTVEKSDKSPTGYTYISEFEKSADQVRREDELLERMKALPAPKKIAAKAA